MCSYDVNVTPDKRKVFLHHEAEVLQALQEVTLAQPLTHLLAHSVTSLAFDLHAVMRRPVSLTRTVK